MLNYKVDVVIDSREASIKIRKSKTVVEYLREFGLKITVQPLPCGDYFLSAKEKNKCCLIERKTITDFANSIRSGRLWSQLQLLALAKEDFEIILLLEGWIKLLEKFTKWKPQAILRLIETIQIKYGIPIVYSPSWEWTALYIKTKAESLGKPEEKKVYPIRHEKKPLSIQERILYVAEGLVGPTLARRLLDEFGTLKRIANASRVELMRVEGIGKERAELIWRVFNTRWNSQGNT